MKIKTDFVTNSSSTSFLIIQKKEKFELTDFLKAVGIADESIFKDIFTKLYDSFESKMKPLDEYIARYGRLEANEAKEGWIVKYFSEEALQKILEAEKNGYKVYYGELASDNGWTEGFFCTDSFIIDTDSMYIDATTDGW